MAFPVWESTRDLHEIMDAFLKVFPDVFAGFQSERIFVVCTLDKGKGEVVKVHPLRYPAAVLVNFDYVFEVLKDVWDGLNDKQKRTWVFRAMCAIPEGGFDSESNAYHKKKKPEISMYELEYAATGGVPNWMENPMALDPMKQGVRSDGVVRCPVTVDDVHGNAADA